MKCGFEKICIRSENKTCLDALSEHCWFNIRKWKLQPTNTASKKACLKALSVKIEMKTREVTNRTALKGTTVEYLKMVHRSAISWALSSTGQDRTSDVLYQPEAAHYPRTFTDKSAMSLSCFCRFQEQENEWISMHTFIQQNPLL